LTAKLGIDRVIVTCEHGGNRVPARYRRAFVGAAAVLATHRGYDVGALKVAKRIAVELEAPLHASTTTRLLIDLNRSLGHRASFSEFSGQLDDRAKDEVIRRYYTPYRTAVRQRIDAWVSRRLRVFHLSVHSFTPVLGGVRRSADIGLLYDPRRVRERGLCDRWLETLSTEGPGLRVRRNYPYRGQADGLTTALRRRLPPSKYLGVELELNQGLLVSTDTEPWLRGLVAESLQTLLGRGADGR
jgi:predicted N-formylglutamate amidohydrolase